MNKLVLMVILLFSIVLASSFALADYEITNFNVTAGGEEVTHVLYKHAQIVNVHLDFLTNESFNVLHADLKPMNIDPNYFSEYSDKSFSCFEKENSSREGFIEYGCKVLNIIFNPQSTELNLNFSFHNVDSITKLNYTKTFLLDDTNPQLKRFQTEYCKDDKCFIPVAKPTKIFIELADNIATFNQEKIFYKIGDSRSQRVTSCEGKVCEGIFTQTVCDSQERVSAEIVGTQGVFSSDDAGNAVEGNLKRTFICDKTAPATDNLAGKDYPIIINVTHSDSQIYPNPKSGDTITITMTVSEDASGLSARMNLTSLGGTYQTKECDVNPGGLDYTCVFLATNVKAGTHSLRVDFTDGVGRENFETFEIQVDEYILPDDGKTPKFLKDITATSPAEKGFNRVALALAKENDITYPLFVTFVPEKNLAVPGSVELLLTQIDDVDKSKCLLYQDGELSDESAISAFEFNVADKLADFKEENKISLKLKLDPNDITDNTKIVCNISSNVRIDGKKVYREPTKFLLTIPLKFKNSRLGDDAPGEQYVNKIHEYQESTKTFYNMVGFMNKIYSNLQEICNAQKSLLGVSQGGVAMNYMASMMENKFLGQLLGGAGGVMTNIGTVGQKTASMANNILVDTDATRGAFAKENLPTSWNLKDIFSQACELATCSVDSQGNLFDTNWAFSGDKPADKFLEDYKTTLPDDKKKETTLSNDKTPTNEQSGEGASDDGLKVSDEDDGKFTDSKTETNLEDKQITNPYGDAALSEIFKDVNVPDVKGSLISAVSARCLPAVIYHLNQFRQMNCQTINCMKTQAAYGTDVSVCEQAKAQFICEKVVGEIFDIGGVRQVKNIMDNTNNFIQGIVPNTLKVLSTNTYCKGYAKVTDEFMGTSIKDDGVRKNDLMKLTLCSIPEVITNTVNHNRKSNPSKRTFQYEVKDDACVLAYCSSINPEECGSASPSMLQQMFPNMNIPSSTLSTLSGQLFVDDKEVDDRLAGKTLNEIKNIHQDDDKFVNGLLAEITGKELNSEAQNSHEIISFETFVDKHKDYLKKAQEANAKGDSEGKKKYLKEAVDEVNMLTVKEFKNNAEELYYKAIKAESEGYVDKDVSDENKEEIETLLLSRVKDLENMGYLSGPDFDYSEFANFEKEYDQLKAKPNVQEFEKATFVVQKSKVITDVPPEKKVWYQNLVKTSNEYLNNDENVEKHNVFVQDTNAATSYVKTQLERLVKINVAIKKTADQYNKCKDVDNTCKQKNIALLRSLSEQRKKQLELISTVYDGNLDELKQMTNLEDLNSLNLDLSDVKTDKIRNVKRKALMEKKKQIEGILDPLANLALDNGWLNWASLSSFGSDTIPGKVSDWSNTWLNSDNYKNKICSANFITPKDASNQKGSAIQCEENLCVPVLTQAVEKTKINETHTLYVATYTVGNVRPPDVFGDKQLINFNVFFKDGNTLSEKLFNVTWFNIKFGAIAGDSFAFISPNDYDEMCLIFEHDFPPDEIGKKKEYCRPIRKNVIGESDFDTGSPMPANYDETANVIVQTTPGSAPMNKI